MRLFDVSDVPSGLICWRFRAPALFRDLQQEDFCSSSKDRHIGHEQRALLHQ